MTSGTCGTEPLDGPYRAWIDGNFETQGVALGWIRDGPLGRWSLLAS